MKIYAMTKKGIYKTENEDRIFVNSNIIFNGFYEFETKCATVCIADGVGGNNGGAFASDFVCMQLSKLKDIKIENIQKINSELIDMSNSNEILNKMATTISGISFSDANAKMFHIGNIRINIMQGRYLNQITEDHTTVNWLVKTGKLSAKEAEQYDKRNEITACMGGGNHNLINQLTVEENCAKILKANQIIITSDGIHEYVSTDELEDLLNEHISCHNICSNIINRAVQNGSKDDRSIIIVIK